MSTGDAALQRMLDKLKQLPELAQRAAPEIAEALRQDLDDQITKGTDPQGKPWQLTQEGKKPLATASKALAITAIGPRILMVLRGHIARHHLGRARGGVQRQVIPKGKTIPPKMSKTIAEILVREFRLTMGGK